MKKDDVRFEYVKLREYNFGNKMTNTDFKLYGNSLILLD